MVELSIASMLKAPQREKSAFIRENGALGARGMAVKWQFVKLDKNADGRLSKKEMKARKKEQQWMMKNLMKNVYASRPSVLNS